MTPKRPYSSDLRWTCSLLVGLLIVLTAWTSAWSLRSLKAGMLVAVHDGQLSVDLREAPVREVLAAIGQQAGLRVHVDGAANRTVNAQFTDVELDQGLRRLLRAASLSYALLYAQGPAAMVVLQEVRVFGEARDAAPARHNQASIVRAQRAATLRPAITQEDHMEPEQEAEPEQEVDPEHAEHEPDGDAEQD